MSNQFSVDVKFNTGGEILILQHDLKSGTESRVALTQKEALAFMAQLASVISQAAQ